MAFSLKALFKGKKKKAQDGDEAGLDDDPFAPSGPEEIPAMEAEKLEAAERKKAGKGKKRKGKGGPLAGLLAKFGAKKKKRKAAAAGPDPFDNPEVMALIAAEVASLPPPETDVPGAEAPPPPEKAPDQPVATGAPDEDLGPYLEEAERPEGDAAGEDMPLGLTAEDEEAFGALAAMEEDDELDAEYLRRKRRNSIIASSLAASVLVALGIGGWYLFGLMGDDHPEMAEAGGGLKVYSEIDGLAPPGEAQSGDRIRMALPPPPTAEAPAAEGGEKSLARRPWLSESGPVSGETTGAGSLPPPAETAEAPATAEAAAEAAVAEAETTAETPPEPEPEPKEVAEAPAAPAAPAEAEAPPEEASAEPQLAGLPPLKEPKGPPAPGEGAATPAYAKLAAIQPPPPGLGEAPLPGLVRQGPLGPLPVKAPDGRAPWQAYARPFDGQGPRLSVIVTGLGLNPEATEAAITKLPPAVTLAFSPYARDLATQVARARSFGHEVLLDLPMEPEDFPAQDPGPLAMLTALPQNDNLTRLETILGKATGYTGLVSRFGGKYGASRVHMRTVLESLGERGLLYVHAAPPEGVRENADLAVPTAQSLLTIDERPFRESIDARLAYAAEAAKLRGTAVVLAQPYPVTFERLARFAAELPKRGVSLAPASAAASLPATAAADGGGPDGRG